MFPPDWHPSIQVSLTRDGKRADIDVDYRSPKFPNALVNGHLRAANSDVRAGNNGGRHNQRWSGLSEWWKMLFGFDLGSQPGKEDITRTATGIPPSPRVTAQKGLDVAVQDFLTAWLLQAQARFAIPYFSIRSYPCLEAISETRGRSVPAGVIRYELLNGMERYAKAIGPVKSLNEIVSPVKLWDPAFRPYKNKYESEFTMFAVPTELATTQDCSGSPPVDAMKKTKFKYGEYFGAAFGLHEGELNQGTLYLLWTKHHKYWQIASVQYVETGGPGLSSSTTPEPPEENVELRTVVGDKEANESMRSFLTAWLLKGDFKAAVSFVSPAAYACFDEPLDPAKGRQAFVTGLAQVREVLGRRTALANYLEPFIPNDLTPRLVTHPDQKAYAILSPSRRAAESLLCTDRDHLDRPAEVQLGEQDYGDYYVTAFRMKVQDGEPAALYTLWAREKDAWKIVAWQLIAP